MSKVYGTCSICGRKNTVMHNLYGYKHVCSKHMHQILTYGHPLDNNPRTVKDLNNFVTRDDGYVEMVVYNQKAEECCRTIIDADVVPLIKNTKWSVNNWGYIYHNYPHTDLHRLITNAPDGYDVDHINGNTLDNRRENLRICTTSENTANKHYSVRNNSGFIGVPPSNRGGWAPEIRFNNIRVHLGRYRNIEEAVFARHVAARYCFKNFTNKEQVEKALPLFKKISISRKEELMDYVCAKLIKYFGSQLR